VKQSLKKKFKKLLNLPNWTEDETQRLSPNLQVYVRAKAREKERVLQRLKYLASSVQNPSKRIESGRDFALINAVTKAGKREILE